MRHSEIRDPRHDGTRKQEADREPEPLAQPLVVGLAVLDETGLLERPEAEHGGRNDRHDSAAAASTRFRVSAMYAAGASSATTTPPRE